MFRKKIYGATRAIICLIILLYKSIGNQEEMVVIRVK